MADDNLANRGEAADFLFDRYPDGAEIIDERQIVVDGIRKSAWWFRTGNLPESYSSQDGIQYWLMSDGVIVPTSIVDPSLKEVYRREVSQ